MNAEHPFSEIGERIRWHRRDFEDLSQDAYALKAGLKRPQLANWETGQFRLSLDGALALRETYGLSLDFIYIGNSDALPATIRRAWMERERKTASQ